MARIAEYIEAIGVPPQSLQKRYGIYSAGLVHPVTSEQGKRQWQSQKRDEIQRICRRDDAIEAEAGRWP